MTNHPDAAIHTDSAEELAAEQDYVSMLYRHLDERRRYTAGRLADVLRAATTGTPQGRSERDVAAAMYSDQLVALDGVEQGLCFGRLDLDGTSDDDVLRYIGRLGLLDEEREYEPLLIDWRAPAARPFYTATAASPEGVRRRRHIRTRSRTVLAIDDEVLDLDSPQPSHSGAGITLTSEAALLAVLGASRTGRMSDIVATIQTEQDRIIRAKPQGVLVVQGGPGTGKTAVALHRAAYLLYTHRRQLAKRGVLVIGPNSTFLRYIGQVLPSLGETSVLLSTVAELYPGLHARGVESAEAAEVKGRAEMVQVVAAAVRDRQQVPTASIELTIDGHRVRLDHQLCTLARTRARRSRRPHNEAKRIFHREVVSALAEQVARGLSRGLLDRELLDRGEVADLKTELRDSPELAAALDKLWPMLSPQRLLTELYSCPQRLATAAQRVLTPDERDLLARPAPDPAIEPEPGQVWTPADVPLLDEAAELLGSDGSAEAAREAAALREELQYAQGVLDMLDLEEDLDPELLQATNLIDADRLADRQRSRRYESTAERAAADRTWTYGHIIIDEAQELSPMAWRVLMQRCPSRSMTVVGDIAQTGDRAGASSWQEVLGPYVAQRWRLEQLTVNYRNPAEIAELADRVLAALDLGIAPPQSVRSTGVPPRFVRVVDLCQELPPVVAAELATVGDGRLAVLGPRAQIGELGKLIEAEIPGPVGTSDGDLDTPVTVLSVAQAKGLEFDAVVLVDPAAILAESPRGLGDLYVALTRATNRLAIVHPGALPEVLTP